MDHLPKRVFMIVWWLHDFGGMERHVVELAAALHRRGVDVRIFSENPIPRRNQYRCRLASEGIALWSPPLPHQLTEALREPSRSGMLGEVQKLICRYLNRRAGAVAAAPAFATAYDVRHGTLAALMRRVMEREAAKSPPELVHVHGFRLGQPWAVPWASSHGWAVAYTEHSTIGDWGGPLERASIREVASAGAIACVSDTSRRSLAALMPQHEIAVHRHIIKPIARRRDRHREGPVAIVCVARLRREKGLDILLRAAARLKQQGHRFRLTIIGSGPDRIALERLGEELGLRDSVEFVGERDAAQIEHELARCDIFVLPSRTEGLPVAVLEAMAAGMAIVATGVGGIPELLNGSTGLMVRPDSVEELAAALTTVVADPGLRAQLQGAACEAFGRSAHDEESAIEAILGSYRRAAAIAGSVTRQNP